MKELAESVVFWERKVEALADSDATQQTREGVHTSYTEAFDRLRYAVFQAIHPADGHTLEQREERIDAELAAARTRALTT